MSVTTGFLTREEAQRLLAELPAHQADMAAFSLATGLRAANVTGFEWSQIDEERKLAGCSRIRPRRVKRLPSRSMGKRSPSC